MKRPDPEFYRDPNYADCFDWPNFARAMERYCDSIESQLKKLLPIQRVSNLTCRCGKPYSQKDLQDGMCHKCCAPTG